MLPSIIKYDKENSLISQQFTNGERWHKLMNIVVNRTLAPKEKLDKSLNKFI